MKAPRTRASAFAFAVFSFSMTPASPNTARSRIRAQAVGDLGAGKGDRVGEQGCPHPPVRRQGPSPSRVARDRVAEQGHRRGGFDPDDARQALRAARAGGRPSFTSGTPSFADRTATR